MRKREVTNAHKVHFPSVVILKDAAAPVLAGREADELEPVPEAVGVGRAEGVVELI